MSILNWLRGKPKQRTRIPPSFTSTVPTPNPDIEFKSVHDFQGWLDALPKNVSFAMLAGGLRRLYHIAFFDHGVEQQDRLLAERLIGVFKKTLEEQVTSYPQALIDFRKATEFTENQIRLTGVNSLFWLLSEKNIPETETIPFIMKPEHGTKLGPLMEMFGVAANLQEADVPTLALSKPHMVRELILQRHGREYPNTVLHLHGLVCNGDPAALAVFSEREIKSLIRAPYDYYQARQVLVELGLLTVQNNALPLTPPPEDSLLKFIVSQTTLDTLAEPAPEPIERIHPPPNMEALDLIIPIALCFHLGLTMIEALYGSEKRLVAMDGIELQFSEAVKNGLMRLVGIMKNFDAIQHSKDGDDTKAGWSMDQAMIFAALQEFDQWPESEEQWESIRPYTQSLSRALHHIRTEYLIRVRSYLRVFIHNPNMTERVSATYGSDSWRNHLQTYLRYGNRAGNAEAHYYGEDWIGIES